MADEAELEAQLGAASQPISAFSSSFFFLLAVVCINRRSMAIISGRYGNLMLDVAFARHLVLSVL